MSADDGWAPIGDATVVNRALNARGIGTYRLGGAAIFTAASPFEPDSNPYPGQADCSGFVAWALMYRRGQWNVDTMYQDMMGPQKRFRLVAHTERVIPSDLILLPGPDTNGDGVPDGHGHVGVITTVHSDFVRGAPGWYQSLEVTHCSGALQLHTDPSTGKPYGAVRTTDASFWRKTGYIVRANHVNSTLNDAGDIIGPSPPGTPSITPVPGKLAIGVAAVGALVLVKELT